MTKELREWKADDVAASAPGTLLYHRLLGERGDGAFAIIRGYTSCCAYLGVPVYHPLAAEWPNQEEPNLPVHGGLTFYGPHQHLSAGYVYWGWDYGHLGDKMLFPPEVQAVLAEAKAKDALFADWPKLDGFSLWSLEMPWTPDMVLLDSEEAIAVFERAMRWATRRVGLRRLLGSSKTRRMRPAMLRVIRAPITAKPEPPRNVSADLREAVRSMKAWDRQRERRQRDREVRELRRMKRVRRSGKTR